MHPVEIVLDHLHDIEEHERKTQRWILPFAIGLAAILVLWLMFLRYL
ncbi:MAG TPA: hypothetical protein VFQ53_41070 [Kofleriaceae bacterium]|nr:hypothetical protein [Kofleriaceae bacterium]